MQRDRTFFELATQLDELISMTSPSAKQVEEVAEFLTDGALERYFFKHLASSGNPGWFEPLRQRGFFSTPPEPIRHGDAISYPRWPALWYLVTIAPEMPQAFVEIAREIDTQDPFVLLELVNTSRKIPASLAADMVPLVVIWADKGMWIGEDVILLAIYLAKGNQWDSALVLLELILSPKKDDVSNRAVTRAEKYFVQEFIEQGMHFFLGQRAIDVLDIVEKRLIQSLEIEGEEADASSGAWRPAIEPSDDQNWGFGEIKDLLVDSAVQTLDHIVNNMPAQGKERVERYLGDPRSIFRRLAIYSIRKNAAHWPDLVEHLFTDDRYFDDRELYLVYHEYWMLTNEAYSLLSETSQNSFANRLFDELPSSQSDSQQRHWVFLRAWAIKDFLHLDEHRRVLAELIREFGEPDHPSFLMTHSGVLTGRMSTKTADDLAGMSLEDILGELQKELPYDGFDGPTQEGLADALKAAIVRRPEHFAPITPQLFGSRIPPIYTFYALSGLREAWKEKDFDWRPVLELCRQVAQTCEQESNSVEPVDMMAGYWTTTYASARGEVASLLEAGVTRDEKAIPPTFLSDVKDILLMLSNDINPSPEYERKRIADNLPYGALTIALNTTRGKAIEGLIQYALHIARANSKEPQQPDQIRSRMEDEVKTKLTEKLDKEIDPSLAVHSLFGKYLPNLHYLDKEWLCSHVEHILPRQQDKAEYWEVAWDGYMFRGDFFGYLYEEILRPYYQYALEQLALKEQGRAGSEVSRAKLAQHIAILYWRGIEKLDEADGSLVAWFLNSSPTDLRATFVTNLGNALREVKPAADSAEWHRARALWTTRFEVIGEAIIKQPGQVTEHRKELGAFIWWVPFIPADLKEFYPMIEASALVSEEFDLNPLIEFLASIVPAHTSFTVSLLEKLLEQNSRGPWFLQAGRAAEHVRAILESAMRLSDEQTRATAVRVVNIFGERGNESYRDLVHSR